MCRVSLIYGLDNYNLRDEIARRICDLQINGSNRPPELYTNEQISIILSRFDITTKDVETYKMPLENEEYVIAYNGEVYGYYDDRGKYIAYYNYTEEYQSDVHFALDIIARKGLDFFISKVDLQGSYIINHKSSGITTLFVDQLNTCGGFYIQKDSKFIFAQEVFILHTILNILEWKDTPIQIINNGSKIVLDPSNFKTEQYFIRNQMNKVWTGDSFQNKKKAISKINDRLKLSTEARIPIKGDFGVLCSGGLDSSIILKHVYDYLSEKDEIDRLHIFTLGNQDFIQETDMNDLHHVKLLITYLGIPNDNLHIINKDVALIERAIKNFVLSNYGRLITPNPSRTQIRHCCQMSAVLANIVMRSPKIKVILTGDFADELFAGYDSMHENISTNEELTSNIRNKLNDLALNDASRVTLASLYGAKMLAGQVNSEIKSDIHPIEIRHPFSSHILLDSLLELSPRFISTLGKDQKPKHILREVGKYIGLPEKIYSRTKVPFNEGGTGVRNSEQDSTETNLAADYLKSKNTNFKKDKANLQKLGILQHIDLHNNIGIDHYAFYTSAMDNGLNKVLKGNAFRSLMPDSIYSTKF